MFGPTKAELNPTYRPNFIEKWGGIICVQMCLYLSLIIIAIAELPNTIWDPDIKRVTLIIGALGLWRYGWWFCHAVRAFIYGHFVYPKLRIEGQKIWTDGWRPDHLHFMITTYKEHREITEKVITSIVNEVNNVDVPATIWLGSGVYSDELLISNLLTDLADDRNINLRIVRQNQSGKRMAIGLVLRAMNRWNIGKDDLVVFMDGDFILNKACISACLPLFKADPDLQAVTTDEDVICFGPKWIGVWLQMRFAQRRLAMQSHALSGRVLTLTGRMSVIRGGNLRDIEFIRLLEADYLKHWLWGRFRFLSGDDKSTWFYMLKKKAKMLYVPDALGYTIEVIEGDGLERMKDNFRRWSGNMLRNGSRAIALGPRAMPFFIWWCLVDQRLSMWTMLVSPILALMVAVIKTPTYFIAYIIFIAVTRMMLSLFLFSYSRTIHISYPFILYLNQLINASVKVYCIFHLAKQKWSNRGNQSLGMFGTSALDKARNFFGTYLVLLYLSMLGLLILSYSELLPLPSWQIISLFIKH